MADVDRGDVPGTVELRAGLPGGDAVVDAEVVWNNVPGNLRRANAPIGMGVRFVDMDAEVYDALPAHRSWSRLWLRFLADPRLGIDSRVTRPS